MADRMFWNLKLRILGGYLLILGVLQFLCAFAEQSMGAVNWIVWSRVGLMMFAYNLVRDQSIWFDQFLWLSSAFWLGTMGVLMLRRKPWLRTYIWVEILIGLPTLFVLYAYVATGPSFHTGSREDHARMILAFALAVVVPVAWAWFLRIQQKKLAQGPSHTVAETQPGA